MDERNRQTLAAYELATASCSPGSTTRSGCPPEPSPLDYGNYQFMWSNT